jgi:hypothetical protein
MIFWARKEVIYISENIREFYKRGSMTKLADFGINYIWR